MRFLKYQWYFIQSPAKAIAALAAEDSPLSIGFKNILLTACLYDLAILLWLIGDAGVIAPPFLAIPAEQYYVYEVFFFIPVFIATWLLGAGIIYLVAVLLGKAGRFDVLLASLGVGISVCAYFTMIPDLIQGVLFSTGMVSQAVYLEKTGQGILMVIVWAYLLGYLGTNIASFAASARHVMGLPCWKAVLVGLAGFLGYFALFFTVIR